MSRGKAKPIRRRATLDTLTTPTLSLQGNSHQTVSLCLTASDNRVKRRTLAGGKGGGEPPTFLVCFFPASFLEDIYIYYLTYFTYLGQAGTPEPLQIKGLLL